MLNYFTFNTTSEMVCLLFSIICLSQDKNMMWRYFMLYLLITLCAELAGIHLKRQHSNNQWIYNLLMIPDCIFISAIFYSLLEKPYKVIVGFTVLILIMYAYETMHHGIMSFNNTTNSLMAVIFVFWSLWYFYLLLKNDKYSRLAFYSDFWWVAGVLFFYFGNTAVNLFRGKLHFMITPKHFLTYYIYNILNILLYGCWSYSFICRRWLTTSKSLS